MGLSLEYERGLVSGVKPPFSLMPAFSLYLGLFHIWNQQLAARGSNPAHNKKPLLVYQDSLSLLPLFFPASFLSLLHQQSVPGDWEDRSSGSPSLLLEYLPFGAVEVEEWEAFPSHFPWRGGVPKWRWGDIGSMLALNSLSLYFDKMRSPDFPFVRTDVCHTFNTLVCSFSFSPVLFVNHFVACVAASSLFSSREVRLLSSGSAPALCPVLFFPCCFPVLKLF